MDEKAIKTMPPKEKEELEKVHVKEKEKLDEKAIKTMPPQEKEEVEKVHVFEAWCKRCGICVAFCPTGALTSDENGLPVLTYPEKCTQCMLCELRCPDFAITVRKKERKEEKAEIESKTE